MKIGIKLTLGFSCIVLAMLLIVALYLNTGEKMHKEFDALKDDIIPGALAMGQMEGASQEIEHDLMEYMVSTENAEKEVMAGLELLAKIGAKHLEHEKHVGVDEKNEAEKLMAKINRFASACTEIIDLKKQGLSTTELLEKREQSLHPTIDSLLEQTRRHKATHMEELAAAKETVHETYVLGTRIALLISTIVAFLATVIAFATTRSITKPLMALHEGAEIIGSGKLDYKVATNARDEIGQLSRAFDQMTVNLQKTTASRDELDATNQQLQANEEQMRILNYHLTERAKELDCLYRVSKLLTEANKSVDDIFIEAVNFIPSAWQYPEITCAKIAVENKEFVTDNFKETNWTQSSDIVVSGKKAGFVEVYYLEEKPVMYEGPFLKEERSLIEALGKQFGNIIEHKKAGAKQNELLACLSKTNQDLEQSNRSLQDFAYIASHDLQEPLRKVLAFGDRLKDSCSDTLDEKEADYLERMLNAAARMKDLINGLLTYSRITTKTKPFEEVDLKRITNEVLSDLEVTIEKMGAEVEVGQLPILQADPMQIRQLMQNLISNALKFHKLDETPIVKITSEISIHQSDETETGLAEDEFCRVIVRDNGIGFEQEYADKIFELFQRLHGYSEYEGTGLGLAVCQKIVQRHNGIITAESSLGEGSTFTITFPIKRVKSKILQMV